MIAPLIDLVDKHNIHLLNWLFGGFTIIIVIFGSLLTFIETKLPPFIRQTFRFGKHHYKGPQDALVSRLEVPKAWFRHFYVTALICSGVALLTVMQCAAYRKSAPAYILTILDLVTAGPNRRRVEIDSNIIVLACFMLFTQCARRFYEVYFVQIFSRKSKMNLSHYLVGHLHYMGAVLAIIAYADGFVRRTQPALFDTVDFTIFQYICIYLFYINWVLQYKTNMILANLRTDAKTGEIKTEKHLLPTEGLFKYISSPHMFTEIMMYLCLWALMPHNTTWLYVVTWVVSNQVMNAVLTHKWYKENFTNYPKTRKAIIPFVL